MHRFTIKELERSDYEVLAQVVRDRRETTTNYYTPLVQRLNQLEQKLMDGHKLTKRTKSRG